MQYQSDSESDSETESPITAQKKTQQERVEPIFNAPEEFSQELKEPIDNTE